ncbi:MAG: hypothetical protein JW846_01450 [Dehalococcoidia bacterium]|nr:hypothetical protein [Dehalococcoidia bacterium]
MKNRKKLLIGVLVATMALVGTIAGTVSADDEGNGNQGNGLMARVAEILGIDQQDVENAFIQANEEMRTERQEQMEAARAERIQGLIDEGVVTQEQVEEWEAWLESRPDNRDAMQEWFEARPEFDGDFPMMDGNRGGMMFSGRDMMPGGRGMMPGGFERGCPDGDCRPSTSETSA